MAAAERALAEFAPTRGYQKAKEAADILGEVRRSLCRGMGNCACEGLMFQPVLCQRNGQHGCPAIGPDGHGRRRSGMMGGYGMVGLYGGPPDTFGNARRGQRRRGRRTELGRPAGPAARRESRRSETGRTVCPRQAAGASEGAVPARYRRQVGQYFQRIAEETERFRTVGQQCTLLGIYRLPRPVSAVRKYGRASRPWHSTTDQEDEDDEPSKLRRLFVMASCDTFSPAPRPRCCWQPLAWAAPDARQSGGEPDGIVQVANLVYAGTKSSHCFSDHFLIKAEKETSISTSRRFHAVKLSSEASTSFRW